MLDLIPTVLFKLGVRKPAAPWCSATWLCTFMSCTLPHTCMSSGLWRLVGDAFVNSFLWGDFPLSFFHESSQRFVTLYWICIWLFDMKASVLQPHISSFTTLPFFCIGHINNSFDNPVFRLKYFLGLGLKSNWLHFSHLWLHTMCQKTKWFHQEVGLYVPSLFAICTFSNSALDNLP